MRIRFVARRSSGSRVGSSWPEVSAASGKGENEMRKKLGVQVAPKPAHEAGALPVSAAAAVVAAATDDVGEAGAISQSCTS